MKQPVTSLPKNDALDQMIDKMVDAQLADGHSQLEPSSGFVASVMESIETAAAEPPPIAFPWRRVLPGVLAILCGLVVLLVLMLRGGNAAAGAGPGTAAQLAHGFMGLFAAGGMALRWILAATCLSMVTIAACFRLAGRSQ